MESTRFPGTLSAGTTAAWKPTGSYFIEEETELVPEGEHRAYTQLSFIADAICFFVSTGDLRLKPWKPILGVAWEIALTASTADSAWESRRPGQIDLCECRVSG